MKKKEIQNKYNISERHFWHLIEDKRIFRTSYRTYELDEDYFKTFSIDAYKQERKNSDRAIKRRLEANKQRSLTLKEYCKSPEVRKRFSDNAKNLWLSEQYRHNNSNAVREAFQRPESKRKLSEASKRMWLKPGFAEKRKQQMKEYWSIEENHVKASKISKSTFSTKKQEILQKQYQTKKKNHSFNSSKVEQHILQQLLQVFPDVMHQYYSKAYPYTCDFYIPSLNLYIECHFNWTHGGRPFDESNKDCIEQLNAWKEKAKTSKFYQNAIETWTIRDVKKRQCAIDNNLNWLCFYNWSQYEQWLSEVQNAK